MKQAIIDEILYICCVCVRILGALLLFAAPMGLLLLCLQAQEIGVKGLY